MSPVSVFPIFFSIAVELILIYFLTKIFKKNVPPVKFASVDGLRGYLAYFVFLHHSCIYFYCATTYQWELPPSNLYIHFGSTSVCLFFMITSFLFFTKLIENKKKPVDWLKLMVSRLLRLYPLYIIAFLISILYAAILSNFKLAEPISVVVKEIGQWFLFSVFDGPQINQLQLTSSFMLSVLWSLAYEWLFYLLLPLIGLIFFRAKPPVLILIVTCVIAYLIISNLIYIYRPAAFYYPFAFLGGIFAAFFARSKTFCEIASGKWASLIIIASLTLTVILFKTAYDLIPLILISIAFIGIACGNTLFGVLTFKLSRALGQLSYGIYLLHGLFLFAIFRFWMSFEEIAAFSTVKYWLFIILIGAVLTIICFFLHYFIEVPALASTLRATAFLRKGIPKFLQQKTEANKDE